MSNYGEGEKNTRKRITRNFLEDYMLKSLLAVVEKEKISVRVTLNIKGAIVSGVLISSQEYCENILRYFREESDLQDPEKLTQDMRRLCEFYKSADRDLADMHYVHLKDARFHYASQDTAPVDQGVFWRGKLASIDGFVFGTLLV